MTSDMNAMPAASTGSNFPGGTPTGVWPSGGSTSSSMAMDDNNNNEDDDDDNLEPDSSSGGSGRKYERKTRRFAWPDELHRLFVAAIFDLGLKNASPKALLPFMEPAATNAGLTTEHLKSHLQKYRLNYEKSRAEFLAYFDESARRNGRRRRRTAKSLESHTRFIFPIAPGMQPHEDPSQPVAPMMEGMPASSQLKINAPARTDSSLAPPMYASLPFSSLTPRSRLKRANFLRYAQQNAAMALASQSALAGFATGLSPRDAAPGAEGVTDAQWGMLASILSPQAGSAAAGGTIPPAPFSLSDEPSPDMQLQMHLAMQAQMNLHRQMLNRKVAVSQHYYNQAAAVKRAAASAMVERALQNHAANNQQQQQQSMAMGGRYHDPSSMAPPGQPARPSLNDGSMMQQQQMLLQHQQQMQQQQQQRYATSSQADALLGPPWDAMDIDMNLNSDDQSDLFGFLKSNE